MIISDVLWGKFTINDKVLIDLLESKPVQRLKKVSQAGASKYLFSWKNGTRYEHSLGVMLLLRKYGAGLQEQIAGLLHDVSHTVFSHVADFLFPSRDHEFHEKHFERIILESEIPEILKKYSFSLKKVLEVENFSLLENKIPDICADRIDYFFRDEYSQLGLTTMIKNSQKHLLADKGEFIFDDAKIALHFARTYIYRDEISWSAPREIACYKVLALALKAGLEEKIITEDDLFTTDDLVFNKLKSLNNSSVNKYLSLINTKFTVKLVNKNKADFFVRNKLRFVDPKVLLKDKKIKRVTEIYPEFAKVLQRHKEKMIKGFYVKIN